MCGIAGIAGEGADALVDRLDAALARLAHRGPDGAGVHRGSGVLLGIRRLAIIDLVAGDQPIYSEDRAIAVVCNGELYNYREELARLAGRGHRFQSASDVNIVPHGYEDEDLAAVERWRGMFAVALWDERRHRLVLWRDRVGKKPLYYSVAGGRLAFASELPALQSLLDGPPVIDPAAIGRYLRYGYIPHPDTLYRGVQSLSPGSLLTFERGRVTVSRYWRRAANRAAAPADRTEALEAIDASILESTRLRLRSDLPVGLFLSGGIDSGLVASAAVRAGGEDLVAFTVSVEDPALDEAEAAEATARHLGLPVERIDLRIAPRDLVGRVATMFGQPFADSSAVPSYAVARAARRRRTVVLNGDGGDEIFAGYRRYQLGRWARAGAAAGKIGGRALSAVGSALSGSRRSAGGFARRALRGFAAPADRRFGLWTTDLFGPESVSRIFPGLPAGEDPEGFPPPYDDLRSMLAGDYEWLLPDDLLVKMDIATMANSLEARSPLLDTTLAELVWSLPDRWILSGGTTKPLLRQLADRYLPASIAAAPKRGFEVPVARWLDDDLRELVHDALLGSDARVREWGDPAAVAAFVDGTTPVDGNRPQMLWALLMLELFLRAPVADPEPVG